MSECEHKHTGSCSPAGVYLYVQCMDCGAILNESDEGRRLRTECPGFKAERYGFGSCKHCHHDAQYHYDALAAENAALRKDAERYRHVWDNWPLTFGEMLQNGYGVYPIENKAQGDAAIDAAMEQSQ